MLLPRSGRSLEELLPELAEDLHDARAPIQLAGQVCWSPAGHRLPAATASYAYLVPSRACLAAYLRVAGADLTGAGPTLRYLRLPATGEVTVLVAGYPGRLHGLALLARTGGGWRLLAGGLPGYRPPAEMDGWLPLAPARAPVVPASRRPVPVAVP